MPALLDSQTGKLCHHQCNCAAVHSNVGIVTCCCDKRGSISCGCHCFLMPARWKEGICHTVICVVDQDIDRAKRRFRSVKQQGNGSGISQVCFQSLNCSSLCADLLDDVGSRLGALEVLQRQSGDVHNGLIRLFITVSKRSQ